jgi:hypothetical protein
MACVCVAKMRKLGGGGSKCEKISHFLFGWLTERHRERRRKETWIGKRKKKFLAISRKNCVYRWFKLEWALVNGKNNIHGHEVM